MVHIKHTPEDFQKSKITLDTHPVDSHRGKCLIIDVPNCQGKTTRGFLMFEDEEEAIKKQVRDLCMEHKPQRVLEVGFGLGYTATQFQECGIKKHVIVEAHPQMVEDAQRWRQKYPDKDIQIVPSFIQEYDYNESDYDLIYDDRYEMVHGDTVKREDLVERGYSSSGFSGQFPCWKVIGDTTKK